MLEDKPEIMNGGIELSMGQKFELEKMNRAIENCSNVEELQSLAKSLASAWMIQKAAAAWMIRQQMDNRSSFTPGGEPTP